MPTSAKPRRRYVPRPISLDPVNLAMAQVATLTARQIATMQALTKAAADAFRCGDCAINHWAALADAINVAEALAVIGIASNYLETFAAGRLALAAIHQRQARHAQDEPFDWEILPSELAAIDEALFMHRIQLDCCSRAELLQAVQTVQRRSAAALAGNAAPGARLHVARR